MVCSICKAFVCDFLATGLPSSVPFRKDIRKCSSTQITEIISDWILNLEERLPRDSLEKAETTANRIARRGRPDSEYNQLLHNATFNFLKFECPWFSQETQFLQTHLLEFNFFKGKHYPTLLNSAHNYMAYITITLLRVLPEIHYEHTTKKAYLKDETDTVVDDDDYQKEILEEVDLSDLCS